MAQLPWHEYARESASQLFDLAGLRRADSLVVAFETALDQKAASFGSAALSEPERDVLAIEALEREVNNGGYAQFFRNSSNAYAAEVVGALQRIGCPKVASITARALKALPPNTPLTPDALSAALAEDDSDREEALDECDQAYYTAGENIAQRLLDYLLENREVVSFGAGPS